MSEKLAHIDRYSSNYEEKLAFILSSKMSVDELNSYRSQLNLYLSSKSLPKSPNYDDLISPQTITINPSNRCNFKCTMCDVPGNNRTDDNLVFDLLKPLVSKFKLDYNIKACML